MAEYQTMRARGVAVSAAEIDQGLRAHMNKVYATMSIGMLITFAAAWAISNLAVTTEPSQAVVQLDNGMLLTSLGAAIYTSPLMYVIMFAPLIFVFGFSAMMNRMSAAAAQVVFYAFAAVMGLSISSIFLVFTGVSIIQTFLITSIAFAGLSLYGYVTKRDLSGMGTFLMMGVIGLIVASIVNLFLGNSIVTLAISALGVLIFAGLTAYDTQAIKQEYVDHAQHGDSEWLGKSVIMGALRLYLDFINMFMFLLQLFGNRN